MTPNDHSALKYVPGSETNELSFLAFGQTVRKFEELPIYCQRQNCSPGILVSSKVRFMWIKWGKVSLVCKGSQFALSNYTSKMICAVLDVWRRRPYTVL